MDGSHHLLLRAAGRRQCPGWEAPWLAARSSGSPFRAPKANPSPSTRSRQRGETILLTYSNGDGRGRLMTVRRPGRTLVMVMVRATFGASLVMETLPTTTVGLGEALPGD
jgi:hypothetical protein